jgi:ATP-binding protein involved in chromosome partitioning
MFRSEHVEVPVLGIVENMAWFTPSKHPDEKYFLFGQGGGKELAKTFNIPLIAQIPINENICVSCDSGKLNELFNDKGIKSGFDNLLKGITNAKTAFVK